MGLGPVDVLADSIPIWPKVLLEDASKGERPRFNALIRDLHDLDFTLRREIHSVDASYAMVDVIIVREPPVIDDVVFVADIEHAMMAGTRADFGPAAENSP
jgi:ketosteroid isomerase-like protein